MRGDRFPAAPAIGDVFTIDGRQQFRCEGFTPYVRKDGTSVELATWSSTCPQCTETFCQSASRATGGVVSKRRCAACKAPLRRVFPDARERRREANRQAAQADMAERMATVAQNRAAGMTRAERSAANRAAWAARKASR